MATLSRFSFNNNWGYNNAMKIRVLLNKVQVDVKDDFLKAKDYFARHGVEIEFDFEESNITGYKVETQNFGSVGYRYQLKGHEKKIMLSKDYITIFVFNGNEFPLSKIPTSKSEVFNECVLVTLMSYKEGDVVGETYSTLIHELMHGLNQLFRNKFLINIDDPMDVMLVSGSWKQYYKNDQPESQDSNFGEAWRRMLPYLPLLNKKEIKYKYFSQAEVEKWKLKPQLWQLLDKLRDECGFAFNINSGLRTEAENKALNGSVSDSAHLSGLACDLAINDSIKRFRLIDIALKNGIKRIGVGKTFVHLDIDETKPQSVVWHYY